MEQNERKRILVIPSWYPTEANPLVGSFFQEQASLLQRNYDIRVLFGTKHIVGAKSALKHFRRYLKRGMSIVRPLPVSAIAANPPTAGFEYFRRSADEPTALRADVNAHMQMFDSILSSGWKPDLLHAHCVKLAGIVAARIADKYHIPWVLTEHQLFILGNCSKYRRRLMLEAIDAASQLLAVSYHQMRCILTQGIQRPIAVVGNLIDEQVFAFTEPNDDHKPFRVLTVAYPHPMKDCETLFKAIALLVEQGHTDIEVKVIGNNSFADLSRANTDYFESLAAAYHLQEVCRFIPYAPREEMPAHYASCDVFVSTSVAETFGLAVREAMAVGRPVLCTASGGVEDDLTPFNGVKVNIRDHLALVDALIAIKTRKLRFDPARIREFVVQRHGRQAFFDRMSTIYNQAMNVR